MKKWMLVIFLGLVLLVIGGLFLFSKQKYIDENINNVEFKIDNSNKEQTKFIVINKDNGKFNITVDTTGIDLNMITTIKIYSSDKTLKFYLDENYTNEISPYTFNQNNEKKIITVYWNGNNIVQDVQVNINVENEVDRESDEVEKIKSIKFKVDTTNRKQTNSIFIDKDKGKFKIIVDTTGFKSDINCIIRLDSSDEKIKFYSDENYEDEITEYEFTQKNEKKVITIYWLGEDITSKVQVNINVENKIKQEVVRYAKMMEPKENYAFWTNDYRKTIKHISFEKGISNVPKDCSAENKCFNVSMSEGKIYAYIVGDYLRIASESEIYAPSNISNIFESFWKLESISFSNFNTSDVTNMDGMFYGCSSLKNLDLSNFNTSKVTNMGSMFNNCSSLVNLNLNSFNTSKVIDMSYMFECCNNLLNLNLSNFDTSNVKTMRWMFIECSSLTSLNLNNFNTSKVTDMQSMFRGCSSLTSLDLSSFNTSRVKNMDGMFDSCSALTNLNLSSFDTSNVIDMGPMFADCSSLTNLNLSNFNTSKVTDMHAMFRGCSSLTSLDLSNFDTSNVKDMYLMFEGCKKLTNLKINFNIEKAEDVGNMFSECERIITQINIINDNNLEYGNIFGNAATYEGSSIILGYTDETYETVIKMKGNNENIILKKIN